MKGSKMSCNQSNMLTTCGMVFLGILLVFALLKQNGGAENFSLRGTKSCNDAILNRVRITRGVDKVSRQEIKNLRKYLRDNPDEGMIFCNDDQYNEPVKNSCKSMCKRIYYRSRQNR
tara:strand:+ start:21 stop:371 length:351 start_codon:yes stop_codon:yes gene_type:complete